MRNYAGKCDYVGKCGSHNFQSRGKKHAVDFGQNEENMRKLRGNAGECGKCGKMRFSGNMLNYVGEKMQTA